jgi:hypothetical protein
MNLNAAERAGNALALAPPGSRMNSARRTRGRGTDWMINAVTGVALPPSVAVSIIATRKASMRAEPIRTFLRAEPFQPFRIKMNSGAVYEVRHPEMIRLVGNDHFLFFHATQDEEDERFEIHSLLLVENIRHIDQPAASATQGS